MMTGREAFEQAFLRLFDTAMSRFRAECTTEAREEAKGNFSRRFAPQLEALDRYLEIAPEAEDTADLKQTALNLRKTLAQMN